MNKKISQQALKQPESNPESGARSVASKKQLDQQEVPDKFHNGRSLPKAEAVKEVKPVDGVSIAAAATQNNGNVLPTSLEHSEMVKKARQKNGA